MRATRRRSSTFSAIAAWATHVQPGSPASLSPRSPRRRPSLGKGRRPSITSVLHIAPTPTTAHPTTPSVYDLKADLTAVGYTSVFLQLPNTPISATLSFSIHPPPPSAAKDIPVSSVTCKPRGLTRFRSLSVLRSRGRSKSVGPGSPTKMKARATVASAASAKRKKAKYPMRPPPLASELALMQFADGGNMDHNIQRVMEAQIKATGAGGRADVYRDGDGGIWWDQDEEWEYTHLLAEDGESRPRASGDLQWATFGNSMSPSTGCIPGEERRGSVSTQDSDLNPMRIVQPFNLLSGDDPALISSVNAPLAAPNPKPGMSLLSVPSRPHRTAKHLRKPDFLVNVAFSHHHAPPKSPQSPTSPGADVGMMRPRGKARRRPAPLNLSPPSPALKQPTNSPNDPDKARQDFIGASFGPAPVSVPVTPSTPAMAVLVTTPVQVRKQLPGSSQAANMLRRADNDGSTRMEMKKKPSVLNMMGLFRSGRKQDTKP